MSSMIVYFIDAAAKTVTQCEITNVGELMPHTIDVGWHWTNGDILYVDDEGLFKIPRHWFWLSDRHDQPLAGNGIVTGREDYDTDITHPPIASLDEIRAKIRFVDDETVLKEFNF